MHTNFVLDNSILFKSACVLGGHVCGSGAPKLDVWNKNVLCNMNQSASSTPHEVCQHTYQLLFISNFTSYLNPRTHTLQLPSFYFQRLQWISCLYFQSSYWNVKLLPSSRTSHKSTVYVWINSLMQCKNEDAIQCGGGGNESDNKTVLQASILKVVSALVCPVLMVYVIGVFTSSPNCFY